MDIRPLVDSVLGTSRSLPCLVSITRLLVSCAALVVHIETVVRLDDDVIRLACGALRFRANQ